MIIFPSLLYIKDLDGIDNASISELSLHLKSKGNQNTTDWKCSTYNTIGKYNLFEDSLFHPLLRSCTDNIKLFSEQYGVQPREVSCVDAWMNVSTKGDYQEYHNHPNCHFSLAYYVKAPENSGKIVFKSHEQDMLPLPVAKYNDYSSTVVSIKPKESMMVAFRSNLLHMVEQNKSDEERISITMNFIVK